MRRVDSECRAVIDTNIWLSAWLSNTGAPARLIEAFPDGSVAIFSEATFAELETRLWRPKFDRYLPLEVRRDLLCSAQGMGLSVSIPKSLEDRHFCRDPDDDKFIHAALAADCRWLVTGDSDLLSLDPLDDLRLVSANDALNQIPWLDRSAL